MRIMLTRQDWLLTNLFLLIGLCSTAFVLTLSIRLTSIRSLAFMVDPIHNFLDKMSWVKRLQYYIAATTSTFGCGATIVSYCIFYALTRDLIRHIEYTEQAILVQARDGDKLHFYHRSLYEYTEKMVASYKLWFAIHSLCFVILVFVVENEWITI